MLECLTLESPALKFRSEYYPERYTNQVPKKIRMRTTIRSQIPGETVMVIEGQEYYVWVNSHGAVSAIIDAATFLGVKPQEFEIIEWHRWQDQKNE